MASESSRSIPSPDSYIGSLISLTSKSEIRYEGILYNINTEESCIGLRNVRSFGTEGRKKDGPQIPAGEKIYEYILFRGSDIKDLQVKASLPVQTMPSHNDPAIIQSNYPCPPVASSSLPSNLPSLGTGAPELSSHSGQVGLQRPTFQASPYPTGGNLGSWGPSPSPPTANGSGVAVPMYWQGYYAPPGGFPHMQQSHLQQQSPLLRPLSGLPIPPMQQTIQFQGMNTSLPSGTPSYPEFSPLFPPVNSSVSLISAPLPSTVAPIQATSFSPEMSQSSVSNKGPTSSLPSLASSGILPPVPPLTLSMETITSLPQGIQSVVSSKPRIGPITSVAHQTEAQIIPSSLGSSSSIQAEASANLVTPGQLMQLTLPMLPSHPSERTTKEVEVKPQEDKTKPLLPQPPAPEPEAKTKPTTVEKEPILPLPTPAYKKPNGAIFVSHESSRGRGRGRGRGSGYPPHPQTKFTEDFDFTAMNEKFNKDEVWGHLGKSISHASNKDEDDDADGIEEDNVQSQKFDVRPVYVKDDFFDTLSSNTNDQTSNGRIKFSEQLKIDTETFGNFSRHRSSYGGGRGLRGGRGRGSYHGRGYGYPGRGRGYTGRGRGS